MEKEKSYPATFVSDLGVPSVSRLTQSRCRCGNFFSLRLSIKKSGVAFSFTKNGLFSNEKEYVTLLYPSVMLDFFYYVANVTLIYTIKKNI